MKIVSIPSVVPEFFDPSLPDFKLPKDSKGTHFRFTIPVTTDPAGEIAAARRKLEAKYPGAVLHLKPEFASDLSTTDAIDVTGSDDALLRRYFNTLDSSTWPDGVTVDQLVAHLQKHLPSAGLFGVQGLEFMSVEAGDVLCFEKLALNLNQKGLTLITGRNLDWGENVSNGSGKSSLASLPFIALFGTTFKSQSDDAWARDSSDKTAWIRLLVRLPGGSVLKVLRSRRPPQLRTWLDDREVSMGDKHATQRQIEGLTNLSWDVLTNAVYVGQREVGSVFGTDKERKELFSRLLGLERFLTAQEKLRRALLRCQRGIEELESEIVAVTAAFDEALRGTDEIRTALKDVPEVSKMDLSAKAEQVSKLAADIRFREKENDDLDPLLAANQKEFEILLDKVARAENDFNALRNRIRESSGLAARCEVCGSRVHPKVLKEYLGELKQKQDAAGMEIETHERAEEVNRTARRAWIEKVQANRLFNVRDRRTLELLTSEVAKIQEQANARKRLEAVLNQKEARVADLSKLNTLHAAARAAWLVERRFLEICVSATGRGGLPAYLCQVAAPQLNAAAARYSEAFSGGEIGVHFETTSEGIVPQVRNLHGGRNFKDQSEGESRIASLITVFAFRDLMPQFNLLCLDEPGAGLDPVNAEAFARGLSQVVGRFHHVLVISHSDRILSGLEPDRIWEVTKQDGVSTVKEL